MNVNNQLGSRPGIRLYPGMSSGGSFSSIIGGGEAPTAQNRGHAASRILKEVQQEHPPPRRGGPIAEDPVVCREPVGEGLRRRTIIDTQDCNKPRSRECRAPVHEEANDRENTSLSFGGQAQVPQRQGRRGQHNSQEGSRPDWMGGGNASHEAPQRYDAPQRSVIDCSPPTSTTALEGTEMPSNHKASAAPQAQLQAVPAGRRAKRESQGLQLGYDDASQAVSSSNDKHHYSAAAQARMKSRPF